MAKKDQIERNWKFFWMVLSIVLLIILLIVLINSSSSKNKAYEELTSQYQNALASYQQQYEEDLLWLNGEWQKAYSDLLNCYENGLSSCRVVTPSLE